jgi:hypothetical protein
MKSFLVCAPILFTTLLLSAPARADVIPPEVSPCVGKAVGATCSFNNATGTCQNQYCPYACLECITSANTSTTTTTNTSTTTTTNTNTDGGAPPSKDNGSCSIGKQVTAKRVAPWLLAGTFSLLFLFGRRRRQS